MNENHSTHELGLFTGLDKKQENVRSQQGENPFGTHSRGRKKEALEHAAHVCW